MNSKELESLLNKDSDFKSVDVALETLSTGKVLVVVSNIGKVPKPTYEHSSFTEYLYQLRKDNSKVYTKLLETIQEYTSTEQSMFNVGVGDDYRLEAIYLSTSLGESD